ncbi:ferritin-like domain-containing protein [Nocardioides sp. Root190]|uniref:ferritin-like domain-containing protein n=1 Tax=Nocardioides sp. Root190 TaxID=1736488 RepID=UPI0006FD2D57|nr:ferritin-like domain-containing protein [Nocardioides sp. Root190]
MGEPTPTPADDATEPLQVALAAEHAAVFVYAALGAQTSRTSSAPLYARVTRAYLVHRNRRDRLAAMIAATGADPVPAEPGYSLPAELGTATAVTARARELEEGAASTYAYLVASTSGAARTWAVEALLDAAVRGLGFGARPERLPGI